MPIRMPKKRLRKTLFLFAKGIACRRFSAFHTRCMIPSLWMHDGKVMFAWLWRGKSFERDSEAYAQTATVCTGKEETHHGLHEFVREGSLPDGRNKCAKRAAKFGMKSRNPNGSPQGCLKNSKHCGLSDKPRFLKKI